MKILVVEDHTMFLEYVVSVLKKRENRCEVLTARDGKQAFALLHENKVDMLITDLNLPRVNGIALIEKTKIYYPHIKIVVLTQYQNNGLVRKMKKLKVDGFLTKNASKDEFHEMIDTVVAGRFSLTTSSSVNTVDGLDKDELLIDPFQRVSQLSSREIEIAKILLENKSNQEVADQLFIGVETVITHRKNVYRKLDVNNLLDLYKLYAELL